MKPRSRNILLDRTFFERDAKVVARELLGKFLVRRHYSLIRTNKRIVRWGKDIAVMITETEAYNGPHDKASHAYHPTASRARASGRTKRNEPMFGEAGVWYVYLCYGVHEMLNIVTGSKEYPAAVLIRGVRYIVQNISYSKDSFSKSVRYIVQNSHRVDGPGKVTKLFKISRALNNKKAARASGLWIEDRGVKIAPRAIMRAVRIGVSYAGPVWSKKKYRFILREHTKK